LGTKQVQQNHLGLVFGLPGTTLRDAFLLFRLDFWVCQDFAAGRIPVFLQLRNKLNQGQFGYHIGAPDA